MARPKLDADVELTEIENILQSAQSNDTGLDAAITSANLQVERAQQAYKILPSMLNDFMLQSAQDYLKALVARKEQIGDRPSS